MSKLIMIFFALVALIQFIRPLGLPGLRHRRDAWKLAAAGFMAVMAIVILRPEGDAPPDAAPQPPTSESRQ